MKNNLRSYLVVVIFLMQNLALFGQTSSDDLPFDFDRAPIDDAHLYIPDNGDPLALWKKSYATFSIDTRIQNSLDYYGFDNPHPYNPFQIKLAYSFLPKLYTTASWLRSNGEAILSGVGYRERMLLGDIGVGAYLVKIDKKERYTPFLKYNAKWMMEKGAQVNALLGYSRGKIQHERSYGFGQGEFNFNRFYGQVGLHFQRGVWGFSGSGKIGLLNYRKVRMVGNAAFELKSFSDLLMEQNNFFFFETSMRFYLGTKFGQVYLNKVYAKTTGALSEYTMSNYLSVGVLLDVRSFYKKKEKE